MTLRIQTMLSLSYHRLGTEDAPGNAGMKDQVALLRWVQKNIGNFGGNAEDVTIAGYSAGASSVELLLLSETTKGLFGKIIPESAAGVGVWSTQSDPIDLAKTIARKHGFESDDVYALEKFYKTTPLEKLNANDYMGNKDSTLSFVPCVERYVGQEMFLREAPDDIMKRGDFPKLPTLVGFADMEGLIRAPQFDQWKDGMNEKFSDFLPADLAFKNDEEREEIAKEIKKSYFGDKPVSEETVQGYVDYFGDVMFRYPAMKSVRYQVEADNEDVYLYVFSYYDNVTLSMRKFPQVKGADHAMQTLTVLEFLDSLKLTADFNKMQAVMRKLWITFVKTGKPVSQPNAEFPGGWPATSADGTPYMELTLPPRLKGYLIQDRVQFLDGVYGKYYRQPVAPSAPGLVGKRSEL